jgi:four helix bundle protein
MCDMGHYKDLFAYQKAYLLAIEVYEISKKFPLEERYSLTDQIRRSSRSVCTNMGEGYRRRKYKNHFVSTLTDSLSENCETEIWLDFAHNFKYISDDEWKALTEKNAEVGRLLNHMINNPEKFM